MGKGGSCIPQKDVMDHIAGARRWERASFSDLLLCGVAPVLVSISLSLSALTSSFTPMSLHTHTHTHIYIYIYITRIYTGAWYDSTEHSRWSKEESPSMVGGQGDPALMRTCFSTAFTVKLSTQPFTDAHRATTHFVQWVSLLTRQSCQCPRMFG